MSRIALIVAFEVRPGCHAALSILLRRAMQARRLAPD